MLNNPLNPNNPSNYSGTYNIIVFEAEDKAELDKIQMDLTDDGWMFPGYREILDFYKSYTPSSDTVRQSTLSFIKDLHTAMSSLDPSVDDRLKLDSIEWLQKEIIRINHEFEVSGSKQRLEPKDGRDFLEQLMNIPVEITGYDREMIREYLMNNINPDEAITVDNYICSTGCRLYGTSEELFDNYFTFDRVSDNLLIIGYPTKVGNITEKVLEITKDNGIVARVIEGDHHYVTEYLIDDVINVGKKEFSLRELVPLLEQLDITESVIDYFGYTMDDVETLLEEDNVSGYTIVR